MLHTDAVAVLALKSSWNNYCPDAELGLKTIAKYLYPNLFGDLEAAPDVDYAPSAVIQEPSEGTSLENFVEENIDLGIVVFAIFVTLIAVFFIAKD